MTSDRPYFLAAYYQVITGGRNDGGVVPYDLLRYLGPRRAKMLPVAPSNGGIINMAKNKKARGRKDPHLAVTTRLSSVHYHHNIIGNTFHTPKAPINLPDHILQGFPLVDGINLATQVNPAVEDEYPNIL